MLIALRLFYRDLRGGDISILLVALTLAVAIVTGIGSFSERLNRGIEQQSARAVGADLVLESPRPMDPMLAQAASSQSLEQSHSMSFATMASAVDQFQIVSIKAIDQHYPLRGQLLLADPRQGTAVQPGEGLRPGRVWAEQRLLDALELAPGDRVEIGDSSLLIDRVLLSEPAGLSGSFALGPRVLMHIDDIPETGVVQPGSRVRHRYYYAGETADLDRWRRQIEPGLLPEQRLRSPRQGRPGLASAMDRASRYLMLGGALGVALAGAAMAIAARRYTGRHVQSVAVLKTLGASARQIGALYAWRLLALLLIATTCGFGLGWLIQQGIAYLIGTMLEFELSPAGAYPYLLGAATGGICLFAFVLPPLLALRQVSPLAALRRDLAAGNPGSVSSWLLGSGGLFALVLLYTGSFWLTAAVFAGLLLAVLLVVLMGLALINATRLLPFRAANVWLLASSSLRRRGLENALQVVVFAITLMLILVLLITRTSLLDEWHSEIPEGTPNHFLVNIMPADVDELQAWIRAHDLVDAGLYPIVRGRLTHIDGQPLRTRLVDDTSTSNGLDRELSLTSSDSPPPDNPLQSGQWWDPAGDAAEVSVESDLAERLGLVLGSALRFQVGSESFTVRVSSIRVVAWENMRPNFYMILPPAVLRAYPITYMTSFYLPADRSATVGELVREFPALTVIDIGDIIGQIRDIVSQVSLAVEAILWIVMSCGALVLIATVQSGLPERFRESSILRTLGAPSRLILGSISAEFLLLGGIAGLLAALGAEASSWILQERLFQVDWRPHPWLWLLGPLLGATLVATIGTLSSRKVVSTPPVAVLRSLH